MKTDIHTEQTNSYVKRRRHYPVFDIHQNLKGEHRTTVYQDSDEDEWILTNKGVTIVGSKAVDTDF